MRIISKDSPCSEKLGDDSECCQRRKLPKSVVAKIRIRSSVAF
jgi:hypothetical protein